MADETGVARRIAACPDCGIAWERIGPDGYYCRRCDREFAREEIRQHGAPSAAHPADGATQHPDPAPADATRFVAQCLDDLFATEDRPLDVVIGDGAGGAILTADGKGMISGATGIGKTNLLLRLDRSICEGSSFLGLPVPQPRRVLHLALEGSPPALKKRLRKVWAGSTAEARVRFFVAHVQLNLANDADLEHLDQLLYSVRPDLLIIDPLRHAHPWDENRSDEMAILTAVLESIITRHGCAIICAHHDRKRPPFAKSDVGTDRVRGSTALTGWISFCLSIDQDVKKDRLVLSWTKTRDAEVPLDAVVVDFDRQTLDFVVNESAAPSGKVSDDAILTAVYRAGEGGIRGTELITGFAQGAGASDRWVRERIRALVKERKVEEFLPTEEKKGAKWYRIAGEDEGQEA